MTKPMKNGRTMPAKRGGTPATSPSSAEQRVYQEGELVPEHEIEMARLRARNGVLEAELLAMRNELIKFKTELQRRVDGEAEEGSTNGKNKAGATRKNGGRSKAGKPKAS